MIVPDNSNPGHRASAVSRLLLLWFLPRLWQPISPETLLPLSNSFEISHYVSVFHTQWIREKAKTAPSFFVALIKTFRRRLLVQSLPVMIEQSLQIGIAVFISQMLWWLLDENAESSKGFLYALGISLTSIALAVCKNYNIRNMKLLGGLVKCVCIEVLFQKTLETSISDFKKSSTLVNLVSQNFDLFEKLQSALMMVYAPVFVVACTCVLCWEMSWVGLVASLVAVLLLPLQSQVMQAMIRYLRRGMRLMDKRVGLLSAAMESVRPIKLFGWGEATAAKVEQARCKEEREVLSRFTVFGCAFSITTCGHALVLLVAFTVYIHVWPMNVPLFIEMWILILSEHYYVSGTMGYASYLFSAYRVTCARATTMLLQQSKDDTRLAISRADAAVHASRFSATWKSHLDFTQLSETKHNKSLTQQDLVESPSTGVYRNSVDMTTCTVYMCTFHVPRESLCMVIGATGSGKTSLLMALLGELNAVEGKLHVSGSIAYVEQEPWLFAGTIRDNITIGKIFDEALYSRVVDACSLTSDFEHLSHGDETVVGSQGTNLSGGQKARIALARALYSERDVYLLDDPLSAVDASVACDLFEYAIKVLLKGKTVILVTHQTQFASEADHVIAMSQGTVVFSGPYGEAVKDGNCASLLEERQRSPTHPAFRAEPATSPSPRKRLAKKAEETVDHHIPLALYKKLFTAGSGTLCVLLPMFLLNVGFLVLYLAVPYWMTLWAAQSWDDQKSDLYPCVLLAIFLLGYTFGVVRLRFLASVLLRSSSALQHSTVRSLLFTRIRYFDTTPVGQILTLFTRDIMSIDSELTENLSELQETLFLTLGYFAIIAILNQYSLPILAVSIALLVTILKKSTPVARDLRLLDIGTKAPILSQISTTLNGLVSVRAYSACKLALTQMQQCTRNNLRAYSHFVLQTNCTTLCMDLSAVLLVAGNSFLVAALKGQLDANTVGIGLSFTNMILALLSWASMKMMMWDNLMTSVQRLDASTQLEPEEAAPGEPFAITHGELQFENVYMAYAPELDFSLQRLSFTISPGSKVGVVGRTGAGKSSLINVVYRLYPIQSGAIRIDGRDIADVDLSDLRKALSVIPQQPFLFAGSLRENLDLFNQHSDDEIWAALKSVGMDRYFHELPGKLYGSLTAGVSLSVGQKQLICLARAILRNNRLLFLDEATANVDHATDEIIQCKTREMFIDCTVITIAHRIRTVIDNDRILVMEDGACAEFDSPLHLLEREDSLFSELVAATGPEESAHLRRLARAS